MMPWTSLRALLESHPIAAVVTVVHVSGSAPREIGARLVVAPDKSFHGTIGGGTLEYQAIDSAVDQMAKRGGEILCHRRWTLGPDLGQCCGGQVGLAIETFSRARLSQIQELLDAAHQGDFESRMFVGAEGVVSHRVLTDAPIREDSHPVVSLEGGVYRESFKDQRTPLMLFGAGHVGRAVVLALAPLPFRVLWVDQRRDFFPLNYPGNVTAVAAQDPVVEVAAAPKDSEALIMTHDHALDLAIADKALANTNIRHVGMIGSNTKAARMRSRLRSFKHTEDALARFQCPIGIVGITAKDPASIAASIAADLLIRREAVGAVHSKHGLALAGRIGGV